MVETIEREGFKDAVVVSIDVLSELEQHHFTRVRV